jgi:hypothetical protein
MSELDKDLNLQTPETVEENTIQDAVVEDIVEEVIEEIQPALLAPGEALIPEDKKQAVEDLVEGLAPLSTGAIGVGKQPRTKKEKPAEPKQGKEKVAIKSTKNVSWMGVGQVKVGINYVSAEEAKEWSTRNHITVLKPEDVAREYGL